MPRYFGPYPYQPFASPVKPPPLQNEGGFCIEVDRKWIPYLVAVLYTLTADQTWSEDQERAIGEAQDIIAQLELMTSCAIEPDLTGIEISEDCEMKIRYCGGKLQICDCGTWVDVPSCDGQGAGPITPSQPGGGTPQPEGGGGTQHICGAIAGLQKWYAPWNVNTGDTLLFDSLDGAWNDGVELSWHCPDGWIFVGGACFWTAVYNGGTDPLIGARHMQIVADIGGTFYDVLNVDNLGAPQPFTVPAGIVNQPMTLQANVDYGGKIYGEVTFCVEITNNQEQIWTSILDFTQQAYAGIVIPLHGVYVAGQGWTGVTFSGLDQSVAQLYIDLPSVHLTGQAGFFTSPGQGGTHGLIGFETQAGAYGAFITPGAVADYGYAQSVDVTAVTRVYCDNNTGTVTGDAIVTQWQLKGVGVKPPTLP